jgi:hypothetical protein
VSRSGVPDGPKLVASQQLYQRSGPDDVRIVGEQRGGVSQAVIAQVAALDDEALQLAAREVAGTISTAEANLAVILAEIERRKIHERWECSNVGRYASWHLQLAPARAQRLATLGERISELPTMAEAVCDGTLSVDKAHSVARAADGSTEGALVELAVQATTAQTQRLCGRWRTFQASDPTMRDEQGDSTTTEDRPPRGTVMVDHDEDGVSLRVRFDHVDGALVLTSLDRATAEVRAERRQAAASTTDPDGSPVPERLSQAEWRAEGLLRLVRHGEEHGPQTGLAESFDTLAVIHVGVDLLLDDPQPGVGPTQSSGGASTGSRPASVRAPSSEPGAGVEEQPSPSDAGFAPASPEAEDAPPPLGSGGTSPPDRPPERGPSAGDPRRTNLPELDPFGVHLHRDLARMLACDAGLLTVIDDEQGEPLHLGPLTSVIPRSVRRRMALRDRTCRWPGCTGAVIEAHHRQHRADHGGHDVENLVGLCRAHHRDVHVHHVRVTLDDDGSMRFWRRNGTEISAAGPPGDPPSVPSAVEAPAELFERHVARGADPTEPARYARWMGDSVDLAEAVDVLLARRRKHLARITPS